MAEIQVRGFEWFIDMVLGDIYAGNSRKSWVLGAGASVDSGIPAALSLCHKWSCEIQGIDYLSTSQADNIRGWHRNRELAPLATVADEIIASGDWTVGQFLGEQYQRVFEIRFTDEAGGEQALRKIVSGKTPSPGYFVLAQLLSQGTSMVITVNFDNLVADALYLTGDHYPVILDHESLAHLVNPTEKVTYLCKIHRTLGKGAMNRKEEVKELALAWKSTLDAVFKNFSPIFLGYGGNDHTLMDYLESSKIRGPIWLLYTTETTDENIIMKLPPRVSEFLRTRQGTVVPYTGFDFLFAYAAKQFNIEIEALVKVKLERVQTSLAEKIKDLSEQLAAAERRQDPIAVARILQAEKSSRRDLSDWIMLAESQGSDREKLAIYNDALRELVDNPWLLSNRGVVKEKMGDIQGAMADFDLAIERGPVFAVTLSNRGSLRKALGNPKGAMADYDRAALIDPGYPLTFNNRGILKKELGDYVGALADLNKAVELDPTYSAAFNNRGTVKSQLGDPDSAMADYDRAIEVDPRNIQALTNRGIRKSELGDRDGAMADYNRAIEIAPKDPTAINCRAALKKELGDIQGAASDYELAIGLDPNFSAALNGRGILKSELGDRDGAMSDYNQALKLDPKNSMFFSNRGILRKELADREGAIADLDRALEINPKNGVALYNRGILKSEMGNREGALEDYDRAIELGSKHAMTFNNRGVLRSELGKQVDAIVDLNRAIELDPIEAAAYINRGRLKNELGDPQGALSDYNLAIKLDPKNAVALNNRGILRSALGDNVGAMDDYCRALELDPTLAMALNNRGVLKRLMGDRDGAMDDYERAIEVDPNGADPWFNKACSAALEGHLEQALEWLEKAIALDPKFSDKAKTDNDFDKIRHEARFQALINRTQLEQHVGGASDAEA